MIKPKLIIPIIISFLLILSSGIYVNQLSNAILFNKNFISSIKEIGLWNILLVLCLILLIIQTKYSFNNFKLKKNTINNILEVACETFQYKNRNWNLRATILECNYLLNKKKTKYFTSSFLYSPERSAILPMDFGVTGEAIFRRETIIKELPNNHMDLYPENIKRFISKDIKFIIASPIYNPNDDKANLLGVLAFDSFSSIQEVDVDEIELKKISQKYADILSLLI